MQMTVVVFSDFARHCPCRRMTQVSCPSLRAPPCFHRSALVFHTALCTQRETLLHQSSSAPAENICCQPRTLYFVWKRNPLTKTKLKFVRVHIMKEDGGLDLVRHSFLTEVLSNEG